MPKISKNASVTLSLICCGIGFLGLVAMAILLPYSLPKGNGGPYDGRFIGQMLPLSYLMLVPVAVADGFLVRLLLLVRKHLVFTDKAVSCLRTISWCCFLEAGLCLVSTILYLRIHLALFFVSGFLGLVLRVVKNVIEEAVALKAENDFTI